MSGHTNWRKLSSRMELEEEFGPLVTAPQMLAYMRGYILALEDTLRDIDTWETNHEMESDYYTALENVRFSVNTSLEEARMSLENLK